MMHQVSNNSRKQHDYHGLDGGRARPFPTGNEGAIRAFGIGVATHRRTRYDTRESQ